ncbi:MAG: GH25 family lysozyme [Pseudomonadota bacterium]
MPVRVLARRLRIVGGIALAMAVIGFAAALAAMLWRPSRTDFPVQGVDVDARNGAIDWYRLHEQGVVFAYIRATAGSDRQDARFADNWRQAYAAGVRRGALHRFSLCQLAADQAGNFVATVGRDDAQLPPAVELKFEPDCTARPDRDVLVGEIVRFLSAIEAHFGKRALLKLSAPFEARYRISEAVDRRLWSVGYFFPPDYLARPWSLWQASGIRRVDGMEQPVHWNVAAR